MVLSKKKIEEEENNVHPSKTQLSYMKVACKGVYFSRTCFHDANDCRNVMVTCPYNEDPLHQTFILENWALPGCILFS